MIAIPNMSKPKNCMDCIVEEYADCDICKGLISASKYADRRYEHCTLIDIVTCGECKWLGVDGGMPFCYWWLREIEPDVFCSYGERRADET